MFCKRGKKEKTLGRTKAKHHHCKEGQRSRVDSLCRQQRLFPWHEAGWCSSSLFKMKALPLVPRVSFQDLAADPEASSAPPVLETVLKSFKEHVPNESSSVGRRGHQSSSHQFSLDRSDKDIMWPQSMLRVLFCFNSLLEFVPRQEVNVCRDK